MGMKQLTKLAAEVEYYYDKSPRVRIFARAAGVLVCCEGGVCNCKCPDLLNAHMAAVGKLKEEGIAQWNPAVKRLDQLKEYQVKYFKNRSYKDFFVQLNFLVYDMKNNSAHRVWPVLTDTSISHEFKVDVPFDQQQDTNATYYFLKEYEVPEDLESKLTLRQEKAEEAYDFYQESKRVTTQYLVSAGAG